MLSTLNYADFLPQILPHTMSGKITYQICINPHTRNDGTSAIFLRLYQNKVQKKIPLNISVLQSQFDTNKGRVKNNCKFHKDYNLLIEKYLSDINKIMVEYRLSETPLSLKKLVEALLNPGLRLNFVNFYANVAKAHLKNGTIKHSSYKQQMSSLEKIKAFQNPVLFSDITQEWLQQFKHHLKVVEKNKTSTIESCIKNFKKYLHAANDSGIKTKLTYTAISVKSMKGDFTFLLPAEVKRLHEFYSSPFINSSWKNILQRYLFACFTGLRISDLEALQADNFFEDNIVFNSQKTGKLQRIRLNETAKELIQLPHVFNDNYTREYINRELKEIAKACGIKKRLYFHSSRHTFATNYLISGGQIQNLQKLLGHSKIETTMVYAHVVDSLMDKEVGYLDGIVG